MLVEVTEPVVVLAHVEGASNFRTTKFAVLAPPSRSAGSKLNVRSAVTKEPVLVVSVQ